MCFGKFYFWLIALLFFAMKVYSIYNFKLDVFILILNKSCCKKQLPEEPHIESELRARSHSDSELPSSRQNQGSEWKIINLVKVVLVLSLALFGFLIWLTFFHLNSDGRNERLKDDMIHLAVSTKFFMCPPEGKIVLE
jgi:hypothetical protein